MSSALRLAVAVVPLLLTGGAFAQPSEEPGHLAFAPETPRQGERVEVVYEPGAGLDGGRDLILRARLRTPDDGAYGEGVDTRTLATLERGADGVYRGAFAYPDSVVFALAAVSAPDGDRVDTNLRQGWPLLAHGAGGRPLVAAYDQYLDDLTGRDFRGGVRVAQRRVEEHPDDPRSWYLLGFFEDASSGAETGSAVAAQRLGRVRAFDEALAAEDAPDPDAVSGLVWLAGTQGEIAERWTDWLIEHVPSHPTAVQFRVYRALREHSTSPDTLLQNLDALWAAFGPAHKVLVDYGFRTALRVGGEEIALRWADRKLQAQPWTNRSVATALAASPTTREEGVRRLTEAIDRTAAAPEEERSLFATTDDHRASRRSRVARLQAALGAALLASGDTTDARAPLEAAAVELWNADLFMDLAEARRAGGDATGAVEAFARVAADPGAADADTARALGAALVGPEAWEVAVTEASDQQIAWTLRSADATRLPTDAYVLDRDNERVRLGDALGGDGPTVAVLFSQFCGYCVAATPEVEALRERLGPDGVRVVMVTAEPPGAEADAFFAEQGYRGPVYHDVNREAARAFGSAGVPAYFVLDREGAVRFRFSSLRAIPRQVAALLADVR